MFAHMPIVRDILYGAASRGASLKVLCETLGIAANELNDSARSVSFEKAYTAWELALKQTGDPLLGLHLGETATPSILGLTGHLMQSSPDLRTAYQQVCEHAMLATDMFSYSMGVKGDQTILTYKPARHWVHVSPDSARAAVEQAIAGTLNVFYLLSGKKVAPLQAAFTFSKPALRKEYERVLGAVAFNNLHNLLVFKTKDLTLPVISYDRSLFAVFDTMVREKRTQRERKTSLADAVKRMLTEDFKGQIVPAEVVASRLAMSVRTFQRKLKEEGTGYRDLAINLRRELALRLLKKPGTKVQEVARLLGYADASALRKALKIN